MPGLVDEADRVPLLIVSIWLGIPMLALRQLQREGCGPDTWHVDGRTYIRRNDLNRWLDSAGRETFDVWWRVYDPQHDSKPPSSN